jgi:hypothetical protein
MEIAKETAKVIGLFKKISNCSRLLSVGSVSQNLNQNQHQFVLSYFQNNKTSSSAPVPNPLEHQLLWPSPILLIILLIWMISNSSHPLGPQNAPPQSNGTTGSLPRVKRDMIWRPSTNILLLPKILLFLLNLRHTEGAIKRDIEGAIAWLGWLSKILLHHHHLLLRLSSSYATIAWRPWSWMANTAYM